jgi:hypothetical protein
MPDVITRGTSSALPRWPTSSCVTMRSGFHAALGEILDYVISCNRLTPLVCLQPRRFSPVKPATALTSSLRVSIGLMRWPMHLTARLKPVCSRSTDHWMTAPATAMSLRDRLVWRALSE